MGPSPKYTKAFRFLLGSIVDLVNFRANDLFSRDDVEWGCEGNVKNMVEETRGEKTEKYYTMTNADGRRSSLQRAIEILMAEVCESKLLKIIKTGLQHQ